jgi:hypothetical protein
MWKLISKTMILEKYEVVTVFQVDGKPNVLIPWTHAV